MKYQFTILIFHLSILWTMNAQTSIISQKTIGFDQSVIDRNSYIEINTDRYLLQFAKPGIGFDKTINGYGEYDAWIVKMDDNFNINGQFLFGGLEDDVPKCLSVFDNGDLLIGIDSYSSNTGNLTTVSFGSVDVVLLRVTPAGVIVWEKRFGGDSIDRVYDIVKLPNDEFIIAAISFSGISGNKTMPVLGVTDIWLLKINASGNLLWQKSFGGSETEKIPLLQLLGNEVILASISGSPISGNKTIDNFNNSEDIWVLKLDQNGNILNEIVIGGSSSEFLSDITLVNNKILITSSSGSGISGNKTTNLIGIATVWIVELDFNFNILNQLSLGGNGNEYGQISLKFQNNYLFLLASSDSDVSGTKTVPSYGNPDLWLIVMDTNYIEYYQASFGGSNDDYALNTHQVNNGKLNIIALSNSPVSGNKTVGTYGTSTTNWLLMLDVPLALNENNEEIYSSYGYPNPFNSAFSLVLGAHHSFNKVEVLDALGRMVYQEVIGQVAEKTIHLPVNMPAGQYTYRLSGDQSSFAGKLVKN